MATNKEFDVELKANDSDELGISILAHKIPLSAKSEVLKKMIDSYEIKDSTKLLTITFSELEYTELKALAEFIYSDGSKLSENEKEYVLPLYIAAAKYEIPHLLDLCRIELIDNLNAQRHNPASSFIKTCLAFYLLDLAQNPFDKVLHDAAFGYIKENRSTASRHCMFKDFVVKYPNLAVEIIDETMKHVL